MQGLEFDEHKIQGFDNQMQAMSSMLIFSFSRSDIPFAADVDASVYHAKTALLSIYLDGERKPAWCLVLQTQCA